MRVVVDGRQIPMEANLHRFLAGPLDFGPYYGNNLAALRNRLSTDVELVWTHWEESRANLGADLFERIRRLFDKVHTQDAAWGLRDRFTFELRSVHTPPA
ncbi:hypothetical protein GCM10022224_087270 [Nonomuraea antimicrobica]|uniref:Barstar (barnase inhibitor) domain-containing protein n=1 Tax=Nonomuraea antimicrobica TaxID=561173 RepID=A0ABP7DS13_9ACTN